MEDRVVIALALMLVMLIASGWLLYRKAVARRKFNIRQSGRGKAGPAVQMEPAE